MHSGLFLLMGLCAVDAEKQGIRRFAKGLYIVIDPPSGSPNGSQTPLNSPRANINRGRRQMLTRGPDGCDKSLLPGTA